MNIKPDRPPAPEPAGMPLEFVTALTNHQADMWAFIVSLMPGHPDVADVLQKANVVLWTKRDSFTPGTNFRAWALSVARFEVLAHLKSLRRQPCFVFDGELLDLLAAEAPEVQPSGSGRLEALEHCLGRLRPQDRELIDQRYRQHGGLERHARRCGRSVSALSVTLFRLRAALRRCISQHLDAEGGRA